MQITTERFDAELNELLATMKANELLSIPGIYEVVSEHFNNEVIERIESIEAMYDDEPQEPSGVIEYTCSKCGMTITAAEADDNGGLCDTCATTFNI